MSYYKILEEFLNNVQQNGTYATREELVEAIIEDDIKLLEELRNNYPIPGYTVGMKARNINVKILAGTMGVTGKSMREDAIFDIASTSKFYTQIIAYNLLKEGHLL